MEMGIIGIEKRGIMIIFGENKGVLTHEEILSEIKRYYELLSTETRKDLKQVAAPISGAVIGEYQVLVADKDLGS